MRYKLAAGCLLFIMACTQKKDTRNESQHIKKLPPGEAGVPYKKPKRPALFTLDDFYKQDRSLEDAVNRIFAGISLQEKAAQLIMPATALYKDYALSLNEIRSLCRQQKIGGVLLLKGNTAGFKHKVEELNRQVEESGSVPLLFAMDGEPALIDRKLTDVRPMPPAAMQTTDAQVTEAAQNVSNLMDEIGVQLNFAPVADRSNNTGIINQRSFGTDENSIVHKAGLFIAQHRKAGKACVIKHFPGHGAVQGDTHSALVFIDGEAVEIPAFAQLLKNSQPAGIMMGHIAVKNNPSWATNGLPASLSPVMMKQLLRDSQHFNGLIFTDAMNMAAVAAWPDAGFRSLAAGADVILMPKNVTELHEQIMSALQRKDNLSAQLEQSVKRVIKLKICLGIITP